MGPAAHRTIIVLPAVVVVCLVPLRLNGLRIVRHVVYTPHADANAENKTQVRATMHTFTPAHSCPSTHAKQARNVYIYIYSRRTPLLLRIPSGVGGVGGAPTVTGASLKPDVWPTRLQHCQICPCARLVHLLVGFALQMLLWMIWLCTTTFARCFAGKRTGLDGGVRRQSLHHHVEGRHCVARLASDGRQLHPRACRLLDVVHQEAAILQSWGSCPPPQDDVAKTFVDSRSFRFR